MLPPKLQQRKLRLSASVPGFEYEYDVCDNYILGICTKKHHQVEYYDLTIPTVKQQLMDAGFVAIVDPPLFRAK